MKITLEEIRRKAVVNTLDGACFGYADDLVADTETKLVLALQISGRHKLIRIVKTEGTAETTDRFINGGGIVEKFLGIFGITR